MKTEVKTIEHGERAQNKAGLDEEAGTLELKKQAHSANINLISYQTASFGANGQTKPAASEANNNTNNQASTAAVAKLKNGQTRD